MCHSPSHVEQLIAAVFSSGKRDGGYYWTINLDGMLIDSPEVIYLLPLE
jgi:hypothetical protein